MSYTKFKVIDALNKDITLLRETSVEEAKAFAEDAKAKGLKVRIVKVTVLPLHYPRLLWQTHHTKRGVLVGHLIELGFNADIQHELSRDEESFYGVRVKFTPKHHFAHISPNDPSLVSFYDSIEDALEDKITTTTLGRYLTEFSRLDRDLITRIATEHEAHAADTQVFFATTPEEIEWCMCSTPDYSCASFSSWPKNNPGNPHPSIVLTEGDISIAYIKKNGIMKSRSFVATSLAGKKVYTPGRGAAAYLASGLNKLGYVSHSEADFFGLRLKKVVDNGFYKGFHLDFFPYFVDMGDYLKITSRNKLNAGFTTVGHYAVCNGGNLEVRFYEKWCKENAG